VKFSAQLKRTQASIDWYHTCVVRPASRYTHVLGIMRELYSIQMLGSLQSAAVTDRSAAQTRPDGAFNIMLLNSHNTMRYSISWLETMRVRMGAMDSASN
jgi:hypothetical protein